MVENLKSTKVSNFEAHITDDGQLYGVGGFYRDTITTALTTGSSGSSYKLMPLPSNIIPEYLTLRSDGTADSPDVDVGLYHSQTDVADEDSFTTALDLDDTGDHVALNIGIGGTYQAAAPKTLWELAGYSADPGGNFYIYLTTDAANVALGVIEVVLKTLQAQ